MGEDERHFLVAPGGRDTVVAHMVGTDQATIINTTDDSALFIFGITKIPNISPEIRDAIQAAIMALLQRNQGR
jgi:hypothetical protein